MAKAMVANIDKWMKGFFKSLLSDFIHNLWDIKKLLDNKGKYHSEGLCWLTTQDECKNNILKCFFYIGLANKNTEHLLSLTLWQVGKTEQQSL